MEDESVQDSDTSQQVGQTPDLLDVLPDGAVEDPAGGQDDVLGEGGIKALRAERAARTAGRAERIVQTTVRAGGRTHVRLPGIVTQNRGLG